MPFIALISFNLFSVPVMTYWVMFEFFYCSPLVDFKCFMRLKALGPSMIMSFWLFSILCLIFLSYRWSWSKFVTCILIDKPNMILSPVSLVLFIHWGWRGGTCWFQTMTSCWLIASLVPKLIFPVLRHSGNSISWNSFIWTFSDATRPWITSGCMSLA